MIKIYIINLNNFDCKKQYDLLPKKIQNKSFLIERRRKQYIASHWLRYYILTKYTLCDFRSLKFKFNNKGRPYIINNDQEIDFNISHSNNYVVMVIAKHQRLGIDVQSEKNINIMKIAYKYFSYFEFKWLNELKTYEEKKKIFIGYGLIKKQVLN